MTDGKCSITATEITGDKTSSACAITMQGLINEGDVSIAAGGISVVASADYHI